MKNQFQIASEAKNRSGAGKLASVVRKSKMGLAMFSRYIFVAVIVFLVAVMVSCGGGGSPKSLAKEGFALQKEAFVVGSGNNVEAANAYMKKFEAHNEKVKKLTPEQKKIYDTELLQLMQAK